MKLLIVPKKKKPRTELPNHVRQIFREFGRQGGLVGGKKRWEGVSLEDRRAYAKKIAGMRKGRDHGER